MKIKGAELTAFLNQLSDDWYFSPDGLGDDTDAEVDLEKLAADKTYDTADLGDAYYQGIDPTLVGWTYPEGQPVDPMIKAWRKARDFDVLVVTTPKGRTQEVMTFLTERGYTVKGPSLSAAPKAPIKTPTKS